MYATEYKPPQLHQTAKQSRNQGLDDRPSEQQYNYATPSELWGRNGLPAAPVGTEMALPLPPQDSPLMRDPLSGSSSSGIGDSSGSGMGPDGAYIGQEAKQKDVDRASNIDGEGADASWDEVFEECCHHTPLEWFGIFLGSLVLCFFLYFFLFGLELLGSSAKVMGGCTAGSMLGDEANPVGSVMIGIITTVVLQSSSTTTSIVVSLVGSEVIATQQAIYMIMGANIGTSVTNTIVAMGQSGDPDMLERAFAGATVHDLFNFMTVAVLLPVEVTTHFLFHLTRAIISPDALSEGEKWEGPIKKIVSPLSKKVMVANKKLMEGVANGDDCDDYYPIVCEDPSNPTKDTCSKIGLIGCDQKTGMCPAFFQPNATRRDDQISGGVVFFIALVVLICCLVGLISILQRMLLGISTRVIYRATNINGYFAIVIGCGITLLVQSSSITTSTLTPLVGMNVLQLEQMYPLTLGANLGTTVTAVLASLVSDNIHALQVALAHLFFNISGILLFFPVPFLRSFPMHGARQLGKATRIWRGFPVIYILCMFFLLPLALFGLSSLFAQGSLGYDVLGAVLVCILVFGILYVVHWWNYRDGRETFVTYQKKRQKRSEIYQSLPQDMQSILDRLNKLENHVGLGIDLDDDDDDDDDDDEEEAAAATSSSNDEDDEYVDEQQSAALRRRR